MSRLLPLAMLAAVLLVACEAAPSTPPAGDGSDAAAPGTDAVADVTLPDLFLGDGLEAQCPGASGCSCAIDSDCSSGVCAETPLGLRCAVLCGAGCPTGTTCKTFSGSGDPVLYCSPVGVRQCAPCQSSQDCVGAWGAAAVCASAGNAGSFCASVCQVSADCPAGTQCVTVSGTTGKVCAPVEGLAACTCSQWATSAKATTSCLVVSGTEACPGSRSCGEAGLSVCSQLAGEQCFDVGCKDAQDGTPCDDADPCTQSECKAGVCTATDTDLCQCQTSADCPDDADLCNGKPFCDKSQTPYQCKTNPASVVTCPKPTNPCDVATCQPDTGSCLVTTAPDTTPCDDGKACTTGDVCMAGKCVSGTVTCTCATDADCAPYEDGNFCNGTLFCNKAKGQCQVNPKTVVVCATGLDTTCEQTLCEPTTGACVLSQAPTSTLCDDGNPCSASDHCDNGECVSSVDICPCEQDADCASSEDNNLCNGTLYCELLSNTCKVNPATVVTCPVDTDNPCSPIECQPATGQCQPSPLLSGSCDDANPCTAKGTCAVGICVPGPDLCQCQNTEDCALFDDANPCNGTLYCDAQTGTCKVNLAEVPVCPPGPDACTANVCDPASGACKLVPAKDGTWCTDGEACTKSDQCVAGACKSGVSVCACLTDADCAAQDDGDPCNGLYFCDKTDGTPQCVLNPQPKAGCVDATGEDDADAGSTADAEDSEDAADAAGQDAELQEVSDASDADAVGDTLGADDLSGSDATEETTDTTEDATDTTEDATDTTEDATDVTDADTSNPTCPDPGDLLVEILVFGALETRCAHDYPAWGLLPLSPAGLVDQGDGTVVDANTGLQWQQYPAGWDGPLQQASSLDLANAKGYCNDLVLGGKDDWYLPTAAELLTLVDYAKANPPVIALPLASPTDGYFWSRTPSASVAAQSWFVQAKVGHLDATADLTPWNVRCVRQHTPLLAAVDPAERWSTEPLLPAGAAADRLTKLVWQAAPAEAALGAAGKMVWQDAVNYCAGLQLGQQGGWRLPQVGELLSLVDRKQTAPALQTLLLGTQGFASGQFWTQTPAAGDPGLYWTVDFMTGRADPKVSVPQPAGVRCVRSITCGDGICDPDEPGVCFADCGCTGVAEGGSCDDGNPCTLADLCTQGVCIGSAKDCTDNLPNTTGICSPDNGQCIQFYDEICNGIDDNNDGTVDNVVCGGGACTCQNGVAYCSTACTTCPDSGDRALVFDRAGKQEVVCAHDYPAWGIAPDSPTTYTSTTDTVTDTQTGLQWQLNFDANFKSLSEARSYCDGLTLASQHDWRLPTITELESLVDYGTASLPPINATFFPGTWQVTYWSETPLLGNPQYAFGVYFALGSSGGSDVTWGNIVARCVRNAQAPQIKAPAQRWTLDTDVAADGATRLFWQRVVPTDAGGLFTHAAAKSYCENLTLGGADTWRLPTIREVRSLVDFSRGQWPVVPPELITQPDSGSWLWSSSLPGASASSAWAISTYNGSLQSQPVGDGHRVLCVRASQCGDGVCDPSETSNCYQDCGCAGPGATPPLVKYYTYQPMTDLLLVIDNSASMEEEQAKLQAIGSYLMTELNNAGIDFHIGAVTTDIDVPAQAGLLRLGGVAPDETRVISLATPFASDVLQDLIGAGVQGSATEAGLAAALAALNVPQGLDWQGTCTSTADCAPSLNCLPDGDAGSVQRCAGPNHPFRRTAAGLDVLFLSDEEDQSSLIVTEVFDQLTQMTKASGRGLGIHAIVGPKDVGCTGGDGDAEAGNRYLQLVGLAGGSEGSICVADYTPIIGNMVKAIRARLLRFSLGAPVVAASLVVKADGVTCPAGSWSYNAQTQSVQIDPDGVCGLSWGDGVEITAVVDCSSGK